MWINKAANSKVKVWKYIGTYISQIRSCNEPPDEKLTLNINIPCCGIKAVTVSQEINGKGLYEEVRNVTGLSEDKIMIYKDLQLIHPDKTIKHYGLANGNYLTINMKGVGGGGGDECSSESGNRF